MGARGAPAWVLEHEERTIYTVQQLELREKVPAVQHRYLNTIHSYSRVFVSGYGCTAQRHLEKTMVLVSGGHSALLRDEDTPTDDQRSLNYERAPITVQVQLREVRHRCSGKYA